jgi:outer membrane protein TolC
MANLSWPLFEGNRTHHLIAEANQQADAARFNAEQAKINLQRDFAKATRELQSLRSQQKLSTEDVNHSEVAARLYYKSYRGGKVNLIDVQSANNRALTAKVSAARISAQILNQIYSLRYISGEGIRGH